MKTLPRRTILRGAGHGDGPAAPGGHDPSPRPRCLLGSPGPNPRGLRLRAERGPDAGLDPPDDRDRLRPAPLARTAPRGPRRPARLERPDARPGPEPRRRRGRPRPGDGRLPHRRPPPEDRRGPTSAPGISVDQLAASKVGQATRFASLEIGCEGGRDAGQCDHGYSCAYQVNLSWRGPSAPAAKEVDPRLVFDRLFGNWEDQDGQRQRRNRSLLDFVAEDARQLRDRIGVDDRRKLDEYLTGVREIERRIDRFRPSVEVGPSTLARPSGIPSDYREHLRLMADLLVLAFRADLTRIATFVFANDGSNRSYAAIGVPEGHHDLSHHGHDPSKLAKIRAINRFHVEQFAYLVERLKAVPEGDGTLLDHGLVTFGSGISDGKRPQPRRPADPPRRPGQRHRPNRPARPPHEGNPAGEPPPLDPRPDGRAGRPLRRQHGPARPRGRAGRLSHPRARPTRQDPQNQRQRTTSGLLHPNL